MPKPPTIPAYFDGHVPSEFDLTLSLHLELADDGRGTFTLFETTEHNRGSDRAKRTGRATYLADAQPRLQLHVEAHWVWRERDCGNPKCEAADYTCSVFGDRFSSCKRRDCFQPEIPAGWKQKYEWDEMYEVALEIHESGTWTFEHERLGHFSGEHEP